MTKPKTLFLVTVALVGACFAGAVAGLWQWGQREWWTRFDVFSIGALLLSALLAAQHVYFFRRLPGSRDMAAEAFGATYDPLMGLWNALLMLAELVAVVDYGHWRLAPWLERGALQTAGLSLFALALLLVAWTDQYLLRHFSAPPANRKIITAGPYRFVRHPRYLGLFLTRVGFALTFASPLAWAFIPLWAVVVLRRIRLEEAHLCQVFGARPRHCPWYEAAINYFGRRCPGRYAARANRTVESLLHTASRRCGHSNFGDGNFREALHVILESFRAHRRLTYVGWGRVHNIILSHLVNRLKIEHSIARTPGILKEQIRRPLFVVGLPRSGTTLMQRLLATDPANRSLRFWEGFSPAPPATAETWNSDPRIARARRLIRAMRHALPDYDTLHPLGPREPDECRMLFMNTFMSSGFSLLAPLPAYDAWLESQDMTDAYTQYRRQLQLLQFGYRRERWVLKSPPHAGNLEALLKVFPDAAIVCLHRDPLKVVPSAASLLMRWRSLFSDAVDPHQLGLELLAYCADQARRLMTARDSLPHTPFHDVHYADLVQDPAETVAGIYARFGLPVALEFEEAIQTWLATNTQHKHGVHHYSLAQHGLTHEQVQATFTDYRARFAVHQE